MKKAIITHKQAETIEKMLGDGWCPEKIVRQHVIGFKVPINTRLNDLSTDEIIRALYHADGYDIQPKLKIGDWVTYWEKDGSDYNKNTSRITGFEESLSMVMLENKLNPATEIVITFFAFHIRPSTPLEIKQEQVSRQFASVGREPHEYKAKDLLINHFPGRFFEIEDVNEFGEVKLVNGFKYRTLDTIKNDFKVACFADDRRDVQIND